jgi:STE24 endopeptidase
VLAVFDAARLLSPGLMEGPHAWLVAVPLMALMIVLLPWLLACLWKTQPLPQNELRAKLEAALRDCNLRVRRILVWQTHGRMTNAAVSGLLPGMRYVFLTDRLLAALDDDEIAAVVRHEAAHVVRHHLLLRLLLLGLPVAVWLAANHVAPQFFVEVSERLAAAGISSYAQQSLLLPAGVALFALVGLGRYCQWLEYEADQYAAGSDPAAMIMALCKIHAESGGGRNRDGWLHPSIARRVRWQRDCTREPALADRFRRQMVFAAWSIAAAYAVCLGVLVFA